MSKEPELGKNFWLAMALSMIVLVGYPYFLRWIAPQKSIPAAPIFSTTTNSPETALPAAPTADDSAVAPAVIPEQIAYTNGALSLNFSAQGGSITELRYEDPAASAHKAKTDFFMQDAGPLSPGTLGVRLAHESADLAATRFNLKSQDAAAGRFEFEYERPGEFRLTKTYLFRPNDAGFSLEITLQNLTTHEKNFAPELIYGMSYGAAPKTEQPFYEALYTHEKIDTAKTHKIEKSGFYADKPLFWAGFLKKYYLFAVKPDWRILAAETRAQEGTLWSILRMDPVTAQPGEKVSRQFFIYAGPERYEALKKTGTGFEAVFSRGFFGLFKVWLLFALKFLNGYVHNYGWSIILLTLGIKILFAPIMELSLKSQKRMQVIQPKLKSLQEHHKNNPEKLHKETMELFKRNRVNPMAGCLPMLIQMPVLMAMYRLLFEAIELQGAPFFGWITDLSQPDRLWQFPFTIPLLNWSSLNVLPFLMVVSQMGFQKVMPQTTTSPDQKMMVAIMPLFFGFICYNMPSGLVLYWFMQNLLSIAQYAISNRARIELYHEDR